MKNYIVIGISGLLMITMNLAWYFYNNTAVPTFNPTAQATVSTVSQAGCNGDCATCGACFRENNTAAVYSSYITSDAVDDKLTAD